MAIGQTVTLISINDLTSTGATAYGRAVPIGDIVADAGGFVWSTSPNPTTTSYPNGGRSYSMTSPVGYFDAPLSAAPPNPPVQPEMYFVPGTTYYIRAFAIEATYTPHTYYSAQITFTVPGTPELPTITTGSVYDINYNTASGSGNATAEGSSTITVKGVCWSTGHNPTIANSHSTDGGTRTGSFYSYMTGLVTGTTYYVRAYATNIVGTSYGNEVSFTTLTNLPTITTTNITNISKTGATGGGNVTNQGAASIVSRGVCWNTTGTPTIANSKTVNGTGTGSFISYLTGLTPNTLYYVRAYATNSVGTGYGNEVTFSTIGDLPTVFTSGLTVATISTASGGGTVLTSGDSAVTARGVCWAATANPTTANSKTVNGSGLGAFTSTLTGLTINTPYYVRAYATSAKGTSYGNQETIEIVFDAPTLSASTENTQTSICWNNPTFQDEIEIYHKEPVLMSGMSYFWDFNDSLADSSSGLTLTASNAYSYQTGLINKGIRTDARNTWIRTTDSVLRSKLSGTSKFTIAFWIYLTRTDQRVQTAVFNSTNTNSGNNSYYINWDSNKFRVRGRQGTETQAKTSPHTGWNFGVITFNGTTSKAYHDAVLRWSENNNVSLTVSNFAWVDYQDYQHAHIIDLGMIFNRDLTQDEITWLYNSGAGRSYDELCGIGFALIDTVDNYTGTTGNCYNVNAYCGENTFKIKEKSGTQYTDFSNEVTLEIYVAPSGLTGTSTFTSINLEWTNNNSCSFENYYLQEFGGSGWTTIATINSGNTTYTLTGLTPNSEYIYRVLLHNTGDFWISDPYSTYTLNPAPYNVNSSYITQISAYISWELISPPAYGDSIQVRIKPSSSSQYTTVATIAASATTYNLTGLIPNTSYDVQIVRIGSEYPSIPHTFTTLTYPPALCAGDYYNVVNSHCGSNDGYIWLDYPTQLLFYDITIKDYEGNSYYFEDDVFSPQFGFSEGLYSGWYRIQALVKPAYRNVFDNCFIKEIQILDSDTTMSYSGTTYKPAICTGFGGDDGRVTYYFTDTNTGSTYTVRIFARTGNEYTEGILIYETTGVSATTSYSFAPLNYTCFYGEIISDSGCKLLLPIACIEVISSLSVEGVNKLWLTEWNDQISYDYWSTSENAWNNPNIDLQYDTSLKLKRFDNLVDTWKSIPLDNVIVEVDQKMNISNVGFTFNDTLTLTFNEYDNAKWLDLSDFYEKTYIIIYQDNNNAYHVMGYRHGAQLSQSETAEGALKLTLTAISEDKILPEIDEQYVIEEVMPTEEELFEGCEFSVVGVKNVYIAGYQTNGELIDFPLEYTVTSGSSESIIKVEWDEDNLTATIGTQELALRKISDYGEGALSFTETFEKNNAGREFIKKLSVKIPNVNLFSTTAIKQYLFSITQEFKLTNNVLFLTDYNDNQWIIGYDNPVKMTSMGITITGNNEYALDFESRSPRRSRNFIKT